MGYTHYWRNAEGFTDGQWTKFVVEAQKLLMFSKIPLSGPHGDEGSKPEITDSRISFNGVEDDAHESFALTKAPQDFEFCKTARKPYDAVVVAVLIEARKANPKVIISSDGGPEVFE